MATDIKTIGFAQSLSFLTPEGEKTGLKFYREDGTNYLDFTGSNATLLSIGDAIGEDYITKTLVEYANGVKKVIDYRMRYEGSYFYFEGEARYEDADGNILPDTTVTIEGQPRYTILGRQEFSHRVPYDDIIMLQASIYYFDSIASYPNDPVAGASPSSINVGGNFYIPIDSDYREVPLSRKQEQDDVLDAYEAFSMGSNSAANEEQLQAYFDWLEENGDGTPIVPDPMEGDPSETGGGGSPAYKPGTKGLNGDGIAVPGLPSTSALQTGFVTAYKMTGQLLNDLASELWNSDYWKGDTFSKFTTDPINAIICCNMIPFAPTTSGSTSIKIGDYTSDVSAELVLTQYKQISCGSITIPERWQNFLDFANTKIEIFLPFVGFRTLNTLECMGQTISVDYNCDLLTGDSVAFVSSGNKVIASFPCNIAAQIPITGDRYGSMLPAWVEIGTSVFSGAAGGGMSGAVTGAGLAGPAGAAAGGIFGGVVGGLSGLNSAASSRRQSIERSGSLGGSSGQLGTLTPYVIISRPIQSLPTNYRNLKAYPSNLGGTLGSFSGLTVVDSCHLDGVSATDREKEEIEMILKQGVII